MSTKALEKRLDSLKGAFLSPLEQELEVLIAELLTFPDGAEVLERLLAEGREAAEE